MNTAMDTTPFNEQVIPCADCAALTTENAQLKAAIEMVKAIDDLKNSVTVGTRFIRSRIFFTWFQLIGRSSNPAA